MPGKRIKDLTALSGAGSANDDDVVIFDTTANETKRISRSQLAEGMQADVQVLTNKTIALGSNTVTGTTAQFNTALTDNDFATLAGAEVLTNKTVALANNTVNYTQGGTGASTRTVQARLKDFVSVKDFGAVGDGTTDDTAAIQAAITAAGNIYIPAGSYKVTSTININANDKQIVGAGIGVTILNNFGTGVVFSLASLGGVSPTIIGGHLADIEINGRDVGGCLRLYDIAQFRVERVKCHDSTASGVSAEMAIDCSFIDCVSIDNAVDGFAIVDSTKDGVEFNSNAVQLYGCVTYGNISAGLRIRRSRGNVVLGGEYSANGYNVILEGGERNSLSDMWIENATTRALQIVSSTSGLGVLYSGNANKITGCMIATGAGTIEVASGDSNFFEANYIGLNMTVAVTATLTWIGRQAGLVGTITDNGSGTINVSNPSNQYIKASGAVRHRMTVGSTVDFTSDIQAYRFASIKGLSSTATPANNIFGFVDIAGAATSANVTFGTAETDAAYGIMFGAWTVAGTPAAGSHNAYMTARATSGFTINVEVAPGVGNTVRIHWMLMR